MIDGWQWDGSLFKGASTYYRRGRLPYAPGFVDTLATVLGLDGGGRLLDVGCGPGIGVRPSERTQGPVRGIGTAAAATIAVASRSERDLRALLREASPGNRFAECLPATEIMVWRRPPSGH
jgi:hypothetical protein